MKNLIKFLVVVFVCLSASVSYAAFKYLNEDIEDVTFETDYMLPKIPAEPDFSFVKFPK